MLRVRLTYAKRGRACFIPHIAIPSVFSRSGARAGIEFQLSEGFSPRPRISLGPELPIGVPALSEPLEVRLHAFCSTDLLRWNRALPEGFFFTGASRVTGEPGSEEAKSLSKWCEASSCILALRGECAALTSPRFKTSEESVPAVSQKERLLLSFLEELRDSGEVLFFERASESDVPFAFRCVMANPAQRSPGLLVKALRKRGIIEGWPDVFILREVVGRLSVDNERGVPAVLPLTPPLSAEIE